MVLRENLLLMLFCLITSVVEAVLREILPGLVAKLIRMEKIQNT